MDGRSLKDFAGGVHQKKDAGILSQTMAVMEAMVAAMKDPMAKTEHGGVLELGNLVLSPRHAALYAKAKRIWEIEAGLGTFSDEIFVRALLIKACEEIVAPVEALGRNNG